MEEEKCLLEEKYSVKQSDCIKGLVVKEAKKREANSRLIEKLSVISKSPVLMEHPQQVAHLNFDELVMGFFPDNIPNVEDLRNAIEHEVTHLLANDRAFPHFHSEAKRKDLRRELVERRRPGHGESFRKLVDLD